MPDQLTMPLERLVRGTDPDTSLEAARKASRASGRAIAAVRAVMADGVGRTDEEINACCRLDGYVASLSTSTADSRLSRPAS